MSKQYNFNISLSILNHLGRNLYRNIITIIGEAISNSWDADAKNVWIKIDRENSNMTIIDDGLGMTDNDFQEKFLKIGYSKRKDGDYKTKSGRIYIGRKGIGKLALLSCAKKIHILSRTEDSDYIGGVVDNSELDKAITEDLDSQNYKLEQVDGKLKDEMNQLSKGTLIFFESLTDGIFNTEEYLKSAIALYFRFSLIDPDFKIHVNGEEINYNQLSRLADDTQFVWKISNFEDPFFGDMKNIQECKDLETKMSFNGYIASVSKPSQLKIRGTEEKVTIDLFVNGRLREKDILRHIPSTRIVESYLYGQIHFNALDTGESKDIFTSSREGIISNEPKFKELLDELNKILRTIIDQWDDFRRKVGNDGDNDNLKIPKQERKAQEMFNVTMEEFEGKNKLLIKGSIVEEWAQELSEESKFNISSYTECFISENLLRKYIKHTNTCLSKSAKEEVEKWRSRSLKTKNEANINYDIRTTDSDEYYLDMDHLANLVDKAGDRLKDPGISRSALIYKPIRDAVGHTSLISGNAKNQLSIEYENIKARLVTLLIEVNKINK